MRLSVGLIAGFANVCRQGKANMEMLLERLGQHMDISHFDRDEPRK